MCKFLLDNLSMLKTNILIMKNEIIEPMVTGHEFLEYIIHYFVYKQTLNYNSTHEMEEDVIKVFNDFDISSVFKIIRSWKLLNANLLFLERGMIMNSKLRFIKRVIKITKLLICSNKLLYTGCFAISIFIGVLPIISAYVWKLYWIQYNI